MLEIHWKRACGPYNVWQKRLLKRKNGYFDLNQLKTLKFSEDVSAIPHYPITSITRLGCNGMITEAPAGLDTASAAFALGYLSAAADCANTRRLRRCKRYFIVWVL